MTFAKLMVTSPGRLLRMVLGIAVMLAGWYYFRGPIGYGMMTLGIIPVSAGIFDVCVFAPLFGAPLNGDEIREMVQK